MTTTAGVYICGLISRAARGGRGRKAKKERAKKEGMRWVGKTETNQALALEMAPVRVDTRWRESGVEES